MRRSPVGRSCSSRASSMRVRSWASSGRSMLNHVPESRTRWLSPWARATNNGWNGMSSPSTDTVMPRSNQSRSPESVADSSMRGAESVHRNSVGVPTTRTSTPAFCRTGCTSPAKRTAARPVSVVRGSRTRRPSTSASSPGNASSTGATWSRRRRSASRSRTAGPSPPSSSGTRTMSPPTGYSKPQRSSVPGPATWVTVRDRVGSPTSGSSTLPSEELSGTTCRRPG